MFHQNETRVGLEFCMSLSDPIYVTEKLTTLSLVSGTDTAFTNSSMPTVCKE